MPTPARLRALAQELSGYKTIAAALSVGSVSVVVLAGFILSAGNSGFWVITAVAIPIAVWSGGLLVIAAGFAPEAPTSVLGRLREWWLTIVLYVWMLSPLFFIYIILRG